MENAQLYCYGIEVDFFQIDEVSEHYLYSFENTNQLIGARNNAIIKVFELLTKYPYINGFSFYLKKLIFIEKDVFGTIMKVPDWEVIYFWRSGFNGDYTKNNSLMNFNINCIQDEKCFLIEENLITKGNENILNEKNIINAKNIISNQIEETYFHFGYLQKLSPLIQKYLFDTFPNQSLLKEENLLQLNQYRLEKKITDFVYNVINKEKKLNPIERILSYVFTGYNNANHHIGFFDGIELFMK